MTNTNWRTSLIQGRSEFGLSQNKENNLLDQAIQGCQDEIWEMCHGKFVIAALDALVENKRGRRLPRSFSTVSYLAQLQQTAYDLTRETCEGLLEREVAQVQSPGKSFSSYVGMKGVYGTGRWMANVRFNYKVEPGHSLFAPYPFKDTYQRFNDPYLRGRGCQELADKVSAQMSARLEGTSSSGATSPNPHFSSK